MSIDVISTILSKDKALELEDVRALQFALHGAGYSGNFDVYGADGERGEQTSIDIEACIEANPSLLRSISPTMVQELFDDGWRDELRAIILDNPDIESQLRGRTQALLEGRSLDELNKADLAALQTAAALLGDYNARIDGVNGPETQKAAKPLKNDFAQAAVPAPRSNSVDLDPTAPLEAVVIDEPAAVVSDEFAAAYANALSFRDPGLKMGDGGEKGWGVVNDGFAHKKDDAVWNLQVLLNRSGADIGVDGQYGPQVREAVEGFQSEHGLPVTGSADMATLTALAALDSSRLDEGVKSNPKDYTVLEQRVIIPNVLGDVQAETGVSGGFLNALWCKETSCGLDQSSGTGSEGPMQITGATFVDLIGRHGGAIVDDLRNMKLDTLADAVQESCDGHVDKDLRYDPRIAMVAAAHVIIDKGVTEQSHTQWGHAYAAYNIGAGGLARLEANLDTKDVANEVGRAAGYNPAFFKNGATGSEVLDNYQSAMESASDRYADFVEPRLEALQASEAQRESSVLELASNFKLDQPP